MSKAHGPQRKRIGPVEALKVEGAPGAPVVVLFHGFGASMEDLAPLAEVLERQSGRKGATWIFPNGHLKVPLGPHIEGRAWFPISVSELERTMAGRAPIDLSELVPPGMKRARENVLEMIEALKVPPEKLLLGGFSQGAMIATDVTMKMATPPAGLALLSGTLVCRTEWEAGARAVAEKRGAKKFPFFQSHGRLDQVLGFGMAEKLGNLLVGAGWQGRLEGFHGAHEIPPETIMRLAQFIRQIV